MTVEQAFDAISSLPTVEDQEMTVEDREAWKKLMRDKYGIRDPFGEENDEDTTD